MRCDAPILAGAAIDGLFDDAWQVVVEGESHRQRPGEPRGGV